MSTSPGATGNGQQPVCPRHPDQVSYVRCQRCERPTCPQCQRQAAVGIQCVDCVAQAAAAAPTATTRYGATVRSGAERPVMTMILIGLCAVVYVGQLASDQVTADLWFLPLQAGDEPWRFLTAAFAHSPGNYLHILFNMYALWVIGTYLEPLLGRLRFLALYLISAIGGSVGYLLFAQASLDNEVLRTPTVGASGAVFGLFAALFVLNRKLGRQTTSIAVILVINAVLGFVVNGIAWQAHLGGAVTGAAIAGVLAWTASTDRRVRAQRAPFGWLGMLLVLLVVLAIAWWKISQLDAGLAALMTGR